MLWYLEEFVSISRMPGWVGWDGMEGEGCHGMGVGLVRGTLCGKSWKIKRLLPTNHPQASLWRPFGFCTATCGTLGAPVCAPFYHLGGTGAFLGQSSKKIRKPNENMSQNGCQKGCVFSLFVGWRALKVMFVFASFSFTILDSFRVTLGSEMLLECNK